MLDKKYSNTKNARLLDCSIARLLDCSIAVIFLFLAAISFTGCADSFINNKGSVLIHVPYGAESNARNAGTEGDKYFCVFGFIFSNGNSKTVEAKSGENVSLTDIPLGKITIDVKAYLINEDKTVGYPDFPVYTGTTEDTVKAGENSIAIVLKNTGMVSLELLGAPRVLKESELADYGITETSVPPKMNGFKYVTFGVFPQTIMAEGVKVADGSKDVNGGVAIKNDEILGADYYLGSDGNWYAKALEYSEASDEQNTAVEYKYSDGTTVAKVSENSFRYFKVEPIVWRVLTYNNNRYMLLSEKGLTANISFYGMGPAYSTDRKLNETRIAETNYKYSNVRAYLNGINNQLITDGGTVGSNDVNFCIDWTGKGFLQQAFTANQQAKIQETTVDYNVAFTEDMDEDNNWYLIPEEDVQGENTEDKLFLLSINEVSDSEYGFLGNDIRDDRYYIRDDRNRARCATDFALANRSNPDRWMLRSTSGTESVYYIGKGVDEMIYFSRYAMAPSQSYSIVPALWVEIPQ